MRLLLDTHALLWFVLSDSKLSEKAADAIGDPENEILLSPASHWELAIKVSLGKYALSVPYESFISNAIIGNDIAVIPIELSHTAIIATLPMHHRDPFDRMIIAQAMVEQIPIVSADNALDAYPVDRLW